MKNLNFIALVALFITCSAFVVSHKKTVHDFKVNDITGSEITLSKYEGKTLLIVNVASKCGLTPQYKDLQEIYDFYQPFGLEILGFPANNFMGQEPGSDDDINTFCTNKFGVTFPMFSKISVKGKNMHPLYQNLQKRK
jgi:glutathione peroxidase